MALQYDIIKSAVEFDITSSSNESEALVGRGIKAPARPCDPAGRTLAMMGSSIMPETERNVMQPPGEVLMLLQSVETVQCDRHLQPYSFQCNHVHCRVDQNLCHDRQHLQLPPKELSYVLHPTVHIQ